MTEPLDQLSGADLDEIREWLKKKLSLEFDIRIIEEHPCERFNKHDVPNFHPESMCVFETNEVYIWDKASHARKAIAHECVHLTRGKPVHNPDSAAGFAEDGEVEKEAMKLVNDFKQREVYDLTDL